MCSELSLSGCQIREFATINCKSDIGMYFKLEIPSADAVSRAHAAVLHDQYARSFHSQPIPTGSKVFDTSQKYMTSAGFDERVVTHGAATDKSQQDIVTCTVPVCFEPNRVGWSAYSISSSGWSNASRIAQRLVLLSHGESAKSLSRTI